MVKTKIIDELEPRISKAMEKKWFPNFEMLSVYMGNGIYRMGRLYSTDTRELFLMFIADMENIDYDGKNEEIEDEVE